MERKTVDITEALTFVFRKDNILKVLMSLLYFIPIALIIPLAVSISGGGKTSILSGLGIFLLIILYIPCMVLFSGYIPLYQHDRALDKNAVLRNPFTCALDSFFAYLKSKSCSYIVGHILGILLFVAILLSSLFLILGPVGAVITGLLSILFTIIFIVFAFICFFKLIPNFSKDLNFVSYLNIVEAFKLTKGVRYGFGAIGIYILIFSILILLLFISVGIVAVFMAFNVSPVIPAFILGIINILGWVYMCFYGANMFGQYTYNAIEQNRGIAPETLPKEINKDTTGIIIAAVVLVLSIIISLVLNIASAGLQSLTSRYENAAAITKVKKSVRDYETFAAVYMAQNDVKNLSRATYNNCAELEKYFKIYEGNGCNFTTYDHTYWQFNYDGSAKISDKKDGATVSVKVGVCYDGTINCESEYPEVNNFLNSR